MAVASYNPWVDRNLGRDTLWLGDAELHPRRQSMLDEEPTEKLGEG